VFVTIIVFVSESHKATQSTGTIKNLHKGTCSLILAEPSQVRFS